MQQLRSQLQPDHEPNRGDEEPEEPAPEEQHEHSEQQADDRGRVSQVRQVTSKSGGSE